MAFGVCLIVSRNVNGSRDSLTPPGILQEMLP